MTDATMDFLASTKFAWQPVSSRVTFAFWKGLSSRKVNLWRLSTSPQPLVGFLSGSGRSPTLEVRAGSFLDASTDEFASEGVRLGEVRIAGRLVLVNSATEFRAYEKSQPMAEAAAAQWTALQSTACVAAPDEAGNAAIDSSARFTLLVHADIKEHR